MHSQVSTFCENVINSNLSSDSNFNFFKLAVGGSFEPVKEEDDEYDVAIKKKLAEKDSKRDDTPVTD